VTGRYPPAFTRPAVFHFCAWIEVGESCKDPLKYYENNVSGTIKLLQAMQSYNSKYFIFSSTAAIFGIPEKVPIQALDNTRPINPYGDTKLAVEKILGWCDDAFGLKYVCLRYFNACGADAAGDLGRVSCFNILGILAYILMIGNEHLNNSR
jgi:UDP-glucose 4-epimerase